MEVPPLAGKIAALSLGALPLSFALSLVAELSQCVGCRVGSGVPPMPQSLLAIPWGRVWSPGTTFGDCGEDPWLHPVPSHLWNPGLSQIWRPGPPASCHLPQLPVWVSSCLPLSPTPRTDPRDPGVEATLGYLHPTRTREGCVQGTDPTP